nr:reverse transcriptase domain-containing protein [Tanacetum cinerariifolium]
MAPAAVSMGRESFACYDGTAPPAKGTSPSKAGSSKRNRRRANRPTRNIVHRDRYGAHDRLVTAFFSEHMVYDEYKFQKTFQMSRTLFNSIVQELTGYIRNFLKTIPESSDDEHKRIKYKQMQEAKRKDVERAFDVLKKNGLY